MRAVMAPMVVALPPLFWVVDATRRQAATTLGRDQGIFQYVAWALGRGAVDYRDIRDVNGPLTHLIHRLFFAFGGEDEHRFHLLDVGVSALVFLGVGACLPGWRSRRSPAWLERAAWSITGWVVLSGQYLLYGFWDAAQRESFFDWFMLSSVALQLAGQGARGSRQPWLLAVAGALSILPWFGKPTYALFTVAQIAVLAVDPKMAIGRGPAIGLFALGGVIGAVAPIAFILVSGDLGAFLRIQLVDVPAMYRFIWARSAPDLLGTPFYATYAALALGGAVSFVALVLLDEMPRRVLVTALVPLCALGSVVIQGKGFPYHFHPVTAGVYLQWIVFASWLTERTRVARRAWALVRFVPIAVGVVLAIEVSTALEASPYIRDSWLLWAVSAPGARTTPEYFGHFDRSDYFPYEMREAAGYLQSHTGPDDRVQTYGMDAYLLFLARRLSATPYIYAYDLNADAALAGGTAARPDGAEAERIRAMRTAHETDLLARVIAEPPAAFVFVDGSPLLSEEDAWDDFEAHCERAADWVRVHYRETARFGHHHVWLRLDLS